MALVYSCCFWFSLRLGSVIIGIFSLIQGVVCLIGSCLGYVHLDVLKSIISHWLDTMDLLYIASVLQIVIKQGPDKYITFGICLTCGYMLLCLLFTYGALTIDGFRFESPSDSDRLVFLRKFNTYMMLGFIVGEFVRFVIIAALCVTWLLIIKRNTVDIGLLIGASIAVGFFLLGMFYLWVCAANLPILIYELEKDEQAATIAKLELMLKTSQSRGFIDYDDDDYDRFNMFTITGNDKNGLKNGLLPYIG